MPPDWYYLLMNGRGKNPLGSQSALELAFNSVNNKYYILHAFSSLKSSSWLLQDSLVWGAEQLDWPNRQTNLEISIHVMDQLITRNQLINSKSYSLTLFFFCNSILSFLYISCYLLSSFFFCSSLSRQARHGLPRLDHLD